MTQYLEALLLLFFGFGWFYCGTLGGTFIANHVKKAEDSVEDTAFISSIIGFALILSVAGMALVGVKSLAFILFLALLVFFFSGGFKLKSFRVSWILGEEHFFFIAFFVGNLIIRILLLYDFSNSKFYTQLDDQYSYLELYVLMKKFGIENFYSRLEGFLYGFDHENKPYHYIEFYLTWIFDLKRSVFSDFKIFQLFTGSFIASLCMNILCEFSRTISPGLKKWKAAVCVFFIFSVSINNEIFNQLSNLLEKGPLNSVLRLFPLQTIHADFFVSGLLPNSVYKISSFLILLSLLYFSISKSKHILFIFCIFLSFVVNYSFVPFFTILAAVLIFQKGDKLWLVFFYPLFLLLFLLSFGVFGQKISDSQMKIGHQIIWSVSSTKNFLFHRLQNFVGNYFSIIFYFSIALVFVRRTWLQITTLILLILFPLIFLIKGVLVKSIILFYVLAIPALLFYHLFRLVGKQTFWPFFTALLGTGFLVHLTLEKNDMWQVFLYPFVGCLFFLLFLALIDLKKNFIVIAIFSVLQLIALCSYAKRIYYRETSSTEFVARFKAKAGNELIRSVYISDPIMPAFLVYEKVGFDIQNECDSLFSTFISIENISRRDSLEIIKAGNLYQFSRLPINSFRNLHPNLSLENCKLHFLKEKNIKVAFLSNNTERKHLNFLNSYLNDSLYNDVEGYWAYFPDLSQIPNLEPN